MSDNAILASQKAQIRRCWICYKSSADGFAISYCKNCQVTSYCGTECQRADWKDHKERCRTTVQHRALLQGIGSALETDKFVEWYMVHRDTVYWAVYHGLDIKAHPENISKQAVHIVLQEVTPGPCSKSDLPSSFVATSIGIHERARVKELMSSANQLALFESANVFDERAKQGGDVGSALVLLQIGAALKFCPLRLAKGELELIPPKSERWREDVLNAFRLGRPIHLSFAGKKPGKRDGRK